MDNLNVSSRVSSDANDLIEFWIKWDESRYSPVKNEDHNDASKECYFNGDAKQTPTSTLRLEKMASVSLAISLWNHTMTLFPDLEPENTKWRSSVFNQIPEWVHRLKLPKSLAKHVVGHFIDIVLQVREWINYHSIDVFRNQFDLSELHLCMRHISWHQNGAINYGQTARNLLKSDELGNVWKYQLACTYCLREEIENLRKGLLGTKLARVARFYYQSAFTLLDYWNCICSRQLYRIPSYNNYITNYSVDEFMIRRTDVKNWPAIEYFFDRMSAEKRVTSAIHFIDAGNVEVQNLMLTKMNETQRLNVYADRATRIIENYLRQGGVDMNELNAISTWYEARGLISKNLFVSLLKKLCRIDVSNAVLAEIWISANVDVKRHILNIDDYDFISEVLRWGCHNRDSEFDFLFVVLEVGAKMAAKPPTKWTLERKRYFKQLCEKLTSKEELDSVNRLLNLCVPDTNASAKIKRILGKMLFTSEDGKRLVVEARFQKLQRFLNFFYPSNVPETRHDKHDLVRENCKRLINEAEFQKLELFLNFFYPSYDPESRQIVRDLLLESLECIDLLSCVLYWGANLKDLNEMPTSLEADSESAEMILQYKTFLLFSKLSVQVYCRNFRLTPDMLNEILSRCFPHDRFIVKLVRMIIFSDEGIRKLHKLLCDKSFPHEVVKNEISPFFQSYRNQRKLRSKLISLLKPEQLRADSKAKENYLQVLYACGL